MACSFSMTLESECCHEVKFYCIEWYCVYLLGVEGTLATDFYCPLLGDECEVEGCVVSYGAYLLLCTTTLCTRQLKRLVAVIQPIF